MSAATIQKEKTADLAIGGFNGKLNANGSEISGEWKQGNRATPLVFKRLAAKGDL